MVLGLRSKTRRPPSMQVEYTVHIQEIKPWPPSQSLKSVKAVVLQWENGERGSGSMGPVAPSASRIEFNESFSLRAALVRGGSGKGKGYQKDVLELSLFEPRREKALKGQLLGNATVDLAELGVLKEAASFGVPLSCKRSYRNTAQPVVYVEIQPLEKESSSASSSFRESENLSKEASLDRDGRESELGVMSEEGAEEAEIASFTDDDVSSHSSHGNLASAPQVMVELAAQSEHQEQRAQCEKKPDTDNEDKGETDLPLESVHVCQEPARVTNVVVANGTGIHQDKNLSQQLPGESSADIDRQDSGDTSFSCFSVEKSDASIACSSPPSSTTFEGIQRHELEEGVKQNVVNLGGTENAVEEPQRTADSNNQNEEVKSAANAESEPCNDDETAIESRNDSDGGTNSHDTHDVFMGETNEDKEIADGSENSMELVESLSAGIGSSANSSPDNGSVASRESSEHTPAVRHKYLQNALRKPVHADWTMSSQRPSNENGGRSLTSDRLKNMRFSMRSPPHPLGNLGSLRYATKDQHVEDGGDIDSAEDVQNNDLNTFTHNRRNAPDVVAPDTDKVKHTSRGTMKNMPDNRIQELERRVEMLEGELREAAAIEISLYSIVAEHGSSVHKVHTPARRLSRLYICASKKWSQERKANAARSAISGLVLAAKACGNDVPRLTFWLSNTIVLRAIVSQASVHPDISNNMKGHSSVNGSRLMAKGKSSPLKWDSFRQKKETSPFTREFEDWESLYTLTSALQRIESWMFSRIVESIWWQSFTPRMQSTSQSDPKAGNQMKRSLGKKTSGVDKNHENFSIETWKKAFSAASEKLCPVRYEGHECGCLPMLARLVMEQCIARLDVAMFNAVLRESADEIPTDPVSDPISNPKVLPIPPGKSSFGAGAQLKNAIGNWSRWLTDLFGMDADEAPDDEKEEDDDRLDVAETLKSFRLLNALSDLLMLPKDMLLEKSIRKEVCQTFSTSIIKQILGSFSPDEFCPDAIPDEVFEALDSEDSLESNKEEIRDYPCNASPISYSAPSVSSVKNTIGDVGGTSVLRRSASSVIRKCHTSDDELDELDSPLSSILMENTSTLTAQRNGGANAIRYQLLRDVWRSDD